MAVLFVVRLDLLLRTHSRFPAKGTVNLFVSSMRWSARHGWREQLTKRQTVGEAEVGMAISLSVPVPLAVPRSPRGVRAWVVVKVDTAGRVDQRRRLRPM